MRHAAWCLLAALVFPVVAHTQPAQPIPADIHLVWMGGDDCPPCKAWRTAELPQLLAAEEFKGVRFSYVVKPIRASVPPAAQLPSEVRPLKDALDRASGGRSGSPQAALVVNGQVYDYYVSVRSAETVLEMIGAVRGEWRYPLPRCLQMAAKGRQCAQPVP
ncbi:hypothetical protein [Hydrogenophaga sp. OTU3427]|uniref:hypothetical protein n=1 Tax=Hydrogenophaga sp. OTU3427 TaxID=3043856 RepID=UPI00313C55AF